MAEMWTCIIKNNGASPVTIEDLGISIDATSQIDFHELFDYTEIADSDDLRDLVTAGTLVINDGSSDLSSADGVEFLAIVHIYYLTENFYTKTQLQTSGQSSVHWDNITDKPDFGAFHWLDPAICRILEFSATPPSSPTEGDFYIDTDDDHLYKYVSSSWVDQGAPSEGDRVINLDSTSEDIYEFESGSWVLNKTPEEGDAIILTDDGDGKSAMYTYVNSIQNEWIKIADVDLLGGTLQQAYDKGSNININNTRGPVTFDASSSTSSPINITELSSSPTTNLNDGDLANIDGRLYLYDSTASMFISVTRQYVTFGRRGNTRNQFLNFGVGVLPSNNSGYRMDEDMVITKITGQFDSSGTADLHIRKNDAVTNIATLSINAATGGGTEPMVSINADDFLQSYCENSSNVSDPVVIVELAYRK